MRSFRRLGLIVVLVLSLATTAAAQETGAAFDDVPPWHWAFDAVQRLGAAGILVGYPRTDRDAALNAVSQVFEAFAHPSHAGARPWAERFLLNLPANWPQPLERSTLVRFRLENARAEVTGPAAVVSFVAVVAMRAGGAVVDSRRSLRVEVRKDADGRLRVNYATLAAGHPQLFK